MPEKVMPGPVEGTGGIREAVCVHTRKIYDSCRDKDCMIRCGRAITVSLLH